jgi:glycosyltransferase involved in cell wall biosynthesis
MTPPSATVVVPAFDAAATIGECVDSLLALRYPAELLEVVVVDNGSRDGTRAVLERYSGRIALVEESRRGPAAARNAGIRRSTADVVAFTDADCTVDPEWLRELVEPLAGPSVGIVGGRILARPDANDAELYGETIHDHYASIHVWRPPYVITMNWASRRSILVAGGLFDETLRRGEDVDLSYRIGAAGYTLVYRPDALVYHRNERTLAGLAREGFQHGLAAPRVLSRHAAYVEQAREAPHEELPATTGPVPERYGRAFRAGKRIGRLAGDLLQTYSSWMESREARAGRPRG